MPGRIEKQIQFIKEIDRLKTIKRQSYIADKSRQENDAEHSWHIAVMALVLKEHSNKPDIDILKVVSMLLIHDIVEIYAGDTFIYDEEGKKEQERKEEEAADKIFSLLPPDQEKEFRDLWDEFEAKGSNEALFAKSMDRLHPMLLNYYAEGETWKKHDVDSSMVRDVNSGIAEGSSVLWEYAEGMIEKAVDKGFLKR
jgi:putative hydrolase of HD superfamily